MKIIICAAIILNLFDICGFLSRNHVLHGNNNQLFQSLRRGNSLIKNIEKPKSLRVIGGEIAHIADYPYVARLVRVAEGNASSWCGATIVSLRWVFTAARCTQTYLDENDIEKQTGFVRSNSSNWDQDAVLHRIVRIHQHEEYSRNDKGSFNDIAVAKVKEAFDGVYEKAIPFARQNYKYVEKSSGTILGWGVSVPTDPTTIENLRYAEVDTISLSDCQGPWGAEVIKDYMVCTLTAGKGMCKSDYGGPLIQDGQLTAIASFAGDNCTDSGFPEVFTKVGAFQIWIYSKVCKKNRRNLIPEVPLNSINNLY